MHGVDEFSAGLTEGETLAGQFHKAACAHHGGNPCLNACSYAIGENSCCRFRTPLDDDMVTTDPSGFFCLLGDYRFYYFLGSVRSFFISLAQGHQFSHKSFASCRVFPQKLGDILCHFYLMFKKFIGLLDSLRTNFIELLSFSC
jgi:hypothetical protein